MVETFTVEEICHQFLCLFIPEYNQSIVPWNLMFFFSHFIWPSMCDLQVEHVTGSVSNCLWDFFVKAITGGLIEASVLQWWEHSPPTCTNVDRFKSRPWHHKWFEFFFGSLLCFERFSPSDFRHQHFQIPIRPLLPADHVSQFFPQRAILYINVKINV